MTVISTGPAWLALALLCVSGAYGLAFLIIRGARRFPAAIAAALAVAALVCFEAVVMNALSLAEAVTRPGVLVAHLLGIGVAGTVAARQRGGRPRTPRRPAALATLLVLPLLALAIASAVRYAPNNGDSMTYHLARVAHWLQDRDVAAYPSGSLRQNVMMPGAEYVLLALQVLSGSDRLAALLQTLAYVVVVASAPVLARLAGAPRRVAPWAAPAVAALPAAVLQASSTQNDLVAAALCIGIVGAAAKPIRRRHATGDVVLLALACSAALLVKASALVVAAPLLVLAAVRQWRRAAGALRSLLPGLAVGALAALVLVAPELARRETAGRLALVVPQYPVAGEWSDRAVNVLRGLAHHLPVPGVAASDGGVGHGEPLVAGWGPSAPHEDYAGNPVQAAALLVAALALLARWSRVPRRGQWAVVAVAAAWIAFHVTLRDNAYLARLQLPLFALAPVFLAAAAPRAARGGVALGLVGALVGLALPYAVVVAMRNPLRPPLEGRSEPAFADYYRNSTIARDAQLTVLDVATATRCDRVGLFMGESGFDYPLTWQAMQRGIAVRHVFGADAWPCLVYFEPFSFEGWDLPREPVALDRASWTPVAANAGGVYLYRRIAPAREAAGPR
ncbi:hypothetical protein [Anaeromyxobacter oryzae]|uniref:Glycosyltransferase RgtA/B/C/D-like domain-containing protein n=1 Tax=Anaeromyxobacter oryzae TaxID=2918170 RepID=A0ABM7X0K0_9BACT|nr:hypothetical protein [Anaeromyxobacter oryzae]BDG05254.1 hypothetical protein AMOR_42500 [Anaeromyxobacter oryzae]